MACAFDHARCYKPEAACCQERPRTQPLICHKEAVSGLQVSPAISGAYGVIARLQSKRCNFTHACCMGVDASMEVDAAACAAHGHACIIALCVFWVGLNSRTTGSKLISTKGRRAFVTAAGSRAWVFSLRCRILHKKVQRLLLAPAVYGLTAVSGCGLTSRCSIKDC